MKRLLFGAIAAVLVAGCGTTTKSRHLDISGAYANQTGTIALGSVKVQSAPEGVESAMVKYEDDTAFFSDKKKHYVSVLLTGTNSTSAATGIVSNICWAFIATVPTIAGASADGKALCEKCGTKCKCDPCKCNEQQSAAEQSASIQSIASAEAVAVEIAKEGK